MRTNLTEWRLLALCAVLLFSGVPTCFACFIQTSWYPNLCQKRESACDRGWGIYDTREECCETFKEGFCEEEELLNGRDTTSSVGEAIDGVGCWMVHTYWPDRACKYTESLCSTYHTVFATEEECCDVIHDGMCTVKIFNASMASEGGEIKCWKAGLWWPQRTCLEAGCDTGDDPFVELFYSNEECCRIVHGHVGGCTENDDGMLTKKALAISIEERIKKLEEAQKDLANIIIDILEIQIQDEESKNEQTQESSSTGDKNAEDPPLDQVDRKEESITPIEKNSILANSIIPDEELGIAGYGGSNRQFDDDYIVPKLDKIPSRPV